MKQFLLIFLTSLFAISAVAQESVKADNTTEVALGAQITFEEESHDFGDIYQGDNIEHVYEFENSGNEALIISNVLTTCGCTATNWPHDPIGPGKKGAIEVTFNSSGKMGKQNKVITVVSNAINSQARVKLITNVIPKSN